MLAMSLIDMPRHAIRVRSVKPRQENQKRLKQIHYFFKHPEAPQTLRYTSLSFQLTGGVEAMVSQVPKTGQPPPMMRLCKNGAKELVDSRRRKIPCSMAASDDPSLDIGAATAPLLATAMELVIRMRQLTGYPSALCRLSRKWFPNGIMGNVHASLATAP